MLASHKADSEEGMLARIKKGTRMTEGSTDKKNLNVHASKNKASKHIKEKLIELKGKNRLNHNCIWTC